MRGEDRESEGECTADPCKYTHVHTHTNTHRESEKTVEKRQTQCLTDKVNLHYHRTPVNKLNRDQRYTSTFIHYTNVRPHAVLNGCYAAKGSVKRKEKRKKTNTCWSD